MILYSSGMQGGYNQGGTFMPEKMAPPKYQVRLICASTHVSLGVEKKGIGGYSPCQSVLASYKNLIASNTSENGAPLFHYKNTVVA